MTEIDISDVRILPVRVGESDLEAEVTTPYGLARVTLDLSRDDVVGVRAVLPSGNQYQSIVDSWASDTGDHETDGGYLFDPTACCHFHCPVFPEGSREAELRPGAVAPMRIE